MADEPVKKKPGRPPLPPEEKKRREQERQKKKYAREKAKRAERAAHRERLQPEFIGKITDKIKDQFVEEPVQYDAPEDPNLKTHNKNPGKAKGVKNKIIYSYQSRKKLEALGYDPIERQIELYSLILDQLAATDEDGKPIIKVGSMAHATMLGHLKALNSDLAKYAYRPIPEKQEIETTDKTPTLINLTLNKPKEEPEPQDQEEDDQQQ
ncbi:hypothetical protein DSS3PM1_00043 [Bacteriophage DSS3_PM1]|nr:hypothetical protein DSS3PM1_00043 [Bacteriophage DSS3_PM1]